jgi:serine kinase of HPr protein (carbohydrate metabolism regulator)
MSGPTSLHATCVVVGEAGVLIRGASGAGKSKLARSLLAEAGRRGVFGRLVGDDRIAVEAAGGRLLATGHPSIAGLIEARGLGILTQPAETSCIARLIVDLVPGAEPRMPAGQDQEATVAGVRLPRLTLGPDADRADLVFHALLRLSSGAAGAVSQSASDSAPPS